MQPLTPREIATATGGDLVQVGGSSPITSISIDTRTLQPGALFVPIIGERFDGHQFLAEAVTRGASALFVARDRLAELPLPTEAHVIAVDEPASALQSLARWHRSAFAGPVVAVTGSNGKTTTKDLIASVLSQRLRVLATPGNRNTEIGMSLTLLLREEDHEAMVVEMGMRGTGQIAALAEIARPTIGVVTNVGPVHFELLGSIDAVSAAKRELIERLPDDGLAVLNCDDSRVHVMSHHTRAQVLTYGLNDGAQVTASRCQSLGLDGYTFVLEHGGAQQGVRLPLAGRHNLSNALAAAAVGVSCGLSLQEIANGLEQVQVSGMRMQIEHLANGVTLINDAYNASPASMRAALNTLREASARRRFAVLGDMLELGAISEVEHQGVGEACAASGVDRLITVGDRARHIGTGAIAAGVDSDKVTSVHHPDEAVALLLTELAPGDVVLVKASRGLQLERVAMGLERGLQERE